MMRGLIHEWLLKFFAVVLKESLGSAAYSHRAASAI